MDVVKRLREYCVCDDGYPEQCAECAGADEIETLRATIAALERELADAKKDTARLDWINRNGDRLADALMTRWIKQNINIRAAIDDAREE